MPGSSILRLCMLGLVVVNLVFVQLTGAASFEWLALLYVLAIASPLLKRLRDNLVYRSLWNVAVIAVCAVLIHHASGYDLQFVLQDGLVLAGLCQVHLLNNLRSEQRPDLLFWNSFLIAVATGYLSHDIVFAFAFLVYVPLYVVGLQLLSVTHGKRELAPGPARRIVWDGLQRSVVLTVCTLGVFLFWPRDFHRSSFLVGKFDFSSGDGASEVGFTDKLELAPRSRTRASSRVVLGMTLESGRPEDVPTLWRGATLSATDGKGWWPLDERDFAHAVTGDLLWFGKDGGLWRGGRAGASGPRLGVRSVEVGANRLFVPLEACRIDLGEDIERGLISPQADATVRYGARSGMRHSLRYGVTLAEPVTPRLAGGIPTTLGHAMSRFLALPRTSRLRAARELALELAARHPADVAQHELVAAFNEYLENTYAYLPPGADGAAETLDEFLAGGAPGHCEFFASALATMLRSCGVPSRVVTGYRATEWDPTGKMLVIRSRDAHAWVEVFDPSAGWYPVDTNPAAASAAGPGLWVNLRSSLGKAWNTVASFDAERRGAVLAWARALPGHAWARLRAQPWNAFLAGLVSILAIAALRRWHQRGTSPTVRRYQRAVRRTGLHRGPGETPRELIDRARHAGVETTRLTALRKATSEHERARYGT